MTCFSIALRCTGLRGPRQTVDDRILNRCILQSVLADKTDDNLMYRGFEVAGPLEDVSLQDHVIDVPQHTPELIICLFQSNYRTSYIELKLYCNG